MICARHKGRPYSSAISAAVPARTLPSALASCFGPSVRPTILRSARAVPPVATAQRGSGGASPANARSTLAWTRSSVCLPGRIVHEEPLGQPQRADVERPEPHGPVGSPEHELRRAAADVAHGDARGRRRKRGHDPGEREASLLLGAQRPHRQPRRARDRVEEVVGVLALTAGSGHEDVHLGGAELDRGAGVASSDLGRPLDLGARDPAGALDVACEPEAVRSSCTGFTTPSFVVATRSRTVFEPTSITATRIGAPFWSADRSASRRLAASGDGPARSRDRAAHHQSLCGDRAIVLLLSERVPGAVSVQLPRVVLSARSASNIAFDPLSRARVVHGHDDLDAVVEVARHQVGAADEVGRLVAGLEDEDAAVLEEAAERRCARGCSRSGPATPGRSEQMLRATMSISAPASEAS